MILIWRNTTRTCKDCLNEVKKMKLKDIIEIDLLEFFKTGKFDFLKLGKSKEWVINNFPDPDYFDADFLTKKVDIWTYGGIELIFRKDLLYAVFSDNWYEGKLCDTNDIKLKKWIFEDTSKLNLLFVLTELNNHQIDYKKKTDKLGVLVRLDSGIELTFDNIEDQEGLSTNDFHMTSFSLVEENPYRWNP